MRYLWGFDNCPDLLFVVRMCCCVENANRQLIPVSALGQKKGGLSGMFNRWRNNPSARKGITRARRSRLLPSILLIVVLSA